MAIIRHICAFGTFGFVTALAAISAAALPTTKPISMIGEGGNDHGFDIAPETRLDVVEAAVAKIPTTLPAGPFEPTWDSLEAPDKLQFKTDSNGLDVTLPANPPSDYGPGDYGYVLKIDGLKMNPPTWTDDGNPIMPAAATQMN